MKRPTEVISKIKHHVPLKYSGELQDLYDYIIFLENLTKTQRTKTIEEYDDFIAKNKGTIDYTTNRPCVKIDDLRAFAKESFMEQMKGDKE